MTRKAGEMDFRRVRATGTVAAWLLGLGLLLVLASSSLAAEKQWSPGDSSIAASPAGAVEEVAPAASSGEKGPDPWQKMNRAIFDFNEFADVYVLAPTARGWAFITPHFFHVAIRNFNDLILMPTILFNDVLQLEGEHAMQDLGRLMFNASFGLLGLIDVATYMGIPQNDADFGETLGYWGVPSGPYLVLPLFGPSTVRGGVGRLGDGAGTFYFSYLPIWATFLVRGVDIISWRSEHLEDVDLSRRESLDYYVFMRDAYLQLRRVKIDEARGISTQTSLEDDDLYFYDEFDDEPEEDDLETDGQGSESRGELSPAASESAGKHGS
ncbi:MAG: VacJ family lipoprotein [Myxococcota bacterium]|nr:VacJ family lipoprotein [Myxococcota bacterium]